MGRGRDKIFYTKRTYVAITSLHNFYLAVASRESY